MNKTSAHPCRSRLGGWWHYYRDDFTPHASQPQPRHTSQPTREAPKAILEQASADQRDKVYTALLDLLALEPQHRADLRRRGLSDSEIARLGFASTPSTKDMPAILKRLAPLGLEGVPGFYRVGDSWRIVDYGSQYFVPYRDTQGRISGMQMKRVGGKYIWFSSTERPGGTGSGSPVHFARPELIADEVLLTEGSLKASVISYLTQSPVIAAAGVTNFGGNFADNLKQRFPELKRVLIAFDADLWNPQKPQVFSALERLAEQLTRARFAVRVRSWSDEYKGLDDYLVAQLGAREVA